MAPAKIYPIFQLLKICVEMIQAKFLIHSLRHQRTKGIQNILCYFIL